MKTLVSQPSQGEQAFTHWLRGFNKRVTNRITGRFAGKHIYAVVHHRGRKSGKPYQTPVVAMPFGDSFILPLPYGADVDWCRNLFAAGEFQMEWRGRRYTLRSPQLIEPQDALAAFPKWLHRVLRRTTVYLKAERAVGPDLPPDPKIGKILVYGAGVLGSLYAGKLAQAGYAVTLLARGQRLLELQEQGLRLVKDGGSQPERITVQLTDHLAAEDAYDWVIVIVRKNQMASVLPALAANQHTPNVLFMVNSAEGPGELIQALGRERVILGFPGAGGQRANGIIHYQITARSTQPTTLGELDGAQSERLLHMAQALQAAGFPTAVSGNMDAWLKTHVALVSPIANAIYMAGGSNYRLAHTRDGLVLMVRAIQENLRVLKRLRIPLTPAKYRAIPWVPEPLLVAVLKIAFDTPQAELVLARHANAARDEMMMLADEFRALARSSAVATPAADTLCRYLNPETPVVPEGQAKIPLRWWQLIAAVGALVSLAWLLSGLRKLFRK